MGEDLNITFERLYELQRLEKERSQLQQLPHTFFVDVVSYLTAKKMALASLSVVDDERERIIVQLKNIRRIITQLYERRQRKIILMAQNKVSTQTKLPEMDALLPEEESFFKELVSVLERNNKEVLLRLLGTHQQETENQQPVALEQSPAVEQASPEKETRIVRFLGNVPQFFGADLESYGPFEEEDTASLPPDLAEILISKSQAEWVEK
ncbi:DNA replication complex GINS family protein [Candidatus Woesearchaeota archaeon]|nr:DNA replication complex GINS family protein [Candidatus Woesearchaeota archaeon]